MPVYDFVKLLSPLDFELLSKDLLEAELKNLILENFREGKDGGIDLRHAPDAVTSTIVQCKRYSSFASLKSELANQELPKIRRLKPTRYILTTTVALSPQQSDELRAILHPFVSTTDDIYGADRLNALLGKHSEVERRHLKLWLSSAGVLDALLHARTHSVSAQEVQRTLASAKIYVTNPSHHDALSILQRERVCIIAGQPGIGKTTLARMLLLHYYRRDYDIIKIESDVSEARDVGYHERPRFYFYDDFLGQTGQAEKLGKNEDQKLLDFIYAVRQSQNSVFVLTTREYILNQAKLHYEKLDREKFDHETCIVDLSKYSRRLRAQILYNHLHFSNLPQEFRAAVLVDKSYKRIVDHPHYNPRLIETMTNQRWIRDCNVTDYVGAFVRALDDPSDIWSHAYQHQLSPRAQHALTVLTTLPYEVILGDLELAFGIYHRRQCNALRLPQGAKDFTAALKELDGTFVTSRIASNLALFRFCNPSIRDFMQRQIVTSEALPSLIDSLVFFEQAHWFSALLEEPKSKLPIEPLRRHAHTIATVMLEKSTFGSCAIIPRGRDSISRATPTIIDRISAIAIAGARSQHDEIGAWIYEQMKLLTADLNAGARQVEAGWIAALPTLKRCGYLASDTGRDMIEELKLMLKDDLSCLSEFERLADFVEAVPDAYKEASLEIVRAQFDEFVQERIYLEDYDDPQEMRDVAERIDRVSSLIEASVSGDFLRDEARRIERESEPDSENSPLIYSNTPKDEFGDADLDSMFKTLT